MVDSTFDTKVIPLSLPTPILPSLPSVARRVRDTWSDGTSNCSSRPGKRLSRQGDQENQG